MASEMANTYTETVTSNSHSCSFACNLENYIETHVCVWFLWLGKLFRFVDRRIRHITTTYIHTSRTRTSYVCQNKYQFWNYAIKKCMIFLSQSFSLCILANGVNFFPFMFDFVCFVWIFVWNWYGDCRTKPRISLESNMKKSVVKIWHIILLIVFTQNRIRIYTCTLYV